MAKPTKQETQTDMALASLGAGGKQNPEVNRAEIQKKLEEAIAVLIKAHDLVKTSDKTKNNDNDSTQRPGKR